MEKSCLLYGSRCVIAYFSSDQRLLYINEVRREPAIPCELQERGAALSGYALFIKTAFVSHTVFQVSYRNSETS